METPESNSNDDGDDGEKKRKYILQEYIRLFEDESSFDGQSYTPKNVSFSPKLNLVRVNTIFPGMKLQKKQFKLNLDGKKEMFLREIKERVEERFINDLKRNNNLLEKPSSPSSSSSSSFVFFPATSNSISASTSASKNKCKFILY